MWLLSIIVAILLIMILLKCVPMPKRVTIQDDSPTLSELMAKHSVTFFGAEWCGYTKKQQAELEGVSGFEKVDCQQAEERCTQEGVSAYPTWKIAGTLHEGYRSKAALKQLLEAA